MNTKALTCVLTLAGVLAAAVPAGAAGAVTVDSATRAGDTLAVGGGSTYAAQPNVTLGTDAREDAPPGFAQIGGDLASVALSTNLDGETTLRLLWAVSPGLNSVPLVTHGWTFCISGDGCYELQTQRFTFGTHNSLPTAADSALYRCADETCEIEGRTKLTTPWIPTYFDGQGSTTTLPAALGLAPGKVITSVTADPLGPVYAAAGFANPATVQRGTVDGIPTVAAYEVPRRQVSVAVAQPGLNPAQVDYGTSVTPNPNGTWSASLDVAGLSGSYTVYARACYGANNCAYTTRSVSL
ncbi:MAG TPA: hypothetical protein VM638_06165 [Actinomycetota bacterium]|nr:hypothetical protein [Actinomycetota bacterium]